jgi:hypothetical protein
VTYLGRIQTGVFTGPVVVSRQPRGLYNNTLGKLNNVVKVLKSHVPLESLVKDKTSRDVGACLPVPLQKCVHGAAQVEADLCDECMDVTTREGAGPFTAREPH